MTQQIHQELQELFALPIAPYPIAQYESQTLYTSSYLKSAFLNSIKYTSKTKQIYAIIEALVKKELIIPCWMNKGVFSSLWYKIKTSPGTKDILGFYEPNIKVVFLLIDNNTNAIGYASNDVMADLIVHESVHMVAGRTKLKFLSFFKPELEQFYSTMFKKTFALSEYPKNVFSIVSYLFTNFELQTDNISNSLRAGLSKLLGSFRNYTTITNSEFNNRIDQYIIAAFKIFTDPDGYVRKINNYSPVVDPIYETYKEVFGFQEISTKNLCVQELILPSEVISVSSEMKAVPPKVYSCLKDLV